MPSPSTAPTIKPANTFGELTIGLACAAYTDIFAEQKGWVMCSELFKLIFEGG